MVRTQIQLPDELYRRAKRISESRELSLAEMARRGLELFLARFPEQADEPAEWTFPTFKDCELLVPLTKLHEIAAEEEATHSIQP